MANRWLDTGCLRAKPKSVNTEKGIIKGVKMCTEGEAKGHGFHLDSEFIDTVCEQGSALTMGIKARFGHPNMCSDALGTFIGRFHNPHTGTTTNSTGEEFVCCFADLHLSEAAKSSPNGDLYKYVSELADKEGDAFGASIVFATGREYRRNDKGTKVFPFLEDGSRNEEWETCDPKLFVECKALRACDVVDEPAANDGMFSTDSVAGQLTEFLDLHPQVLEVLSHPEIIEAIAHHGDKFSEFLGKYQSYQAELNIKPALQQEADMPKPKQEPKKPEVAADTAVQEDVLTAKDVKGMIGEALLADRERSAVILELGEKWGLDEDAKQFAKEGKSLSDFQAHISSKSPEEWKESLRVKNPSTQMSEEEAGNNQKLSETEQTILERRAERYGIK